MESTTKGSLYIVATPIGNLADITLRALEILKSVNLIAAEDTRHSRRLLDHYGIQTKLLALHEHNEEQKSLYLVDLLNQGQSIALISDAGTPLISDPGYRLVTLVKNAGFNIIPIPGPCAAIAALSAAGLPTDRFHFLGFLPSKAGARRHLLEHYESFPETLVFYEAPHRIVELFEDLVDLFGPQREAAIARELTKTFETIRQNTIADLLDFLKQDPNQQRGEFVVLIRGKIDDLGDLATSLGMYEKIATALPMKEAVRLTAEITGVKKNALYEAVLKKEKTDSHEY